MDVYCERVGPELLAEPLNAITNASFLLAAWAAWVLARRVGALSPGVKVLVAPSRRGWPSGTKPAGLPCGGSR
jgi:hypothetical protein